MKELEKQSKNQTIEHIGSAAVTRIDCESWRSRPPRIFSNNEVELNQLWTGAVELETGFV